MGQSLPSTGRVTQTESDLLRRNSSRVSPGARVVSPPACNLGLNKIFMGLKGGSDLSCRPVNTFEFTANTVPTYSCLPGGRARGLGTTEPKRRNPNSRLIAKCQVRSLFGP